MTMLGRDGVLRRLNAAHDTVVDYVQLSPRHLSDYTAEYPPEAREMWADIDDRAVTSEAQLWAVPDDVVPREPNTLVSVPHTSSLLQRQENPCRLYPCEEDDECQAEHPGCNSCDIYYECIGGSGSCTRYNRCDDTLKKL
jgi:hypothetical protein